MTDTTQSSDMTDSGTDSTSSDVSVPEILEPVVATHTAESLGLALPDDRSLRDEVLLGEIGTARTQAAEQLENFQRVSAEFDNYRKRTERDRVETVIRASQRVIESLLPALDSLDAAMSVAPTSDSERVLHDGVTSTRLQILDALKADGLEEIAEEGALFDPALHEAVSVIPGDGDQVVHQVVRKGFVMSGRVIRPALVVVGHKTTEDTE